MEFHFRPGVKSLINIFFFFFFSPCRVTRRERECRRHGATVKTDEMRSREVVFDRSENEAKEKKRIGSPKGRSVMGEHNYTSRPDFVCLQEEEDVAHMSPVVA